MWIVYWIPNKSWIFTLLRVTAMFYFNVWMGLRVGYKISFRCKLETYLKSWILPHFEDLESLIVENLFQFTTTEFVIFAPPLNSWHWFTLDTRCIKIPLNSPLFVYFFVQIEQKIKPGIKVFLKEDTSELHVMFVIFPAQAKNSLGWFAGNLGRSAIRKCTELPLPLFEINHKGFTQCIYTGISHLTFHNDSSVPIHLSTTVLCDARVVGRIFRLQVGDGQIELVRSWGHHLYAISFLSYIRPKCHWPRIPRCSQR